MTGSKNIIQNVLKFLMRRGHSKEDAEDLIQQAYLRTLEYYRNGGEIKNEAAYVMQTAKHCRTDKYRHDQLVTFAGQDIGDLDKKQPIFDQAPGPDGILEAQQRLTRLADGLNALNRMTAGIFMAHRAGYSYDEIAAYYGISNRAVETHMARATKWLMDNKEPL
jgi:RNA polymerase sigma-70 factor (ECF subfamily)